MNVDVMFCFMTQQSRRHWWRPKPSAQSRTGSRWMRSTIDAVCRSARLHGGSSIGRCNCSSSLQVSLYSYMHHNYAVHVCMGRTMYMYVCLYVFMFICMHVCMCLHVIHVKKTCVSIYACMYAYMHTCNRKVLRYTCHV